MKTAKRKHPKDINSLSEVQSVRQHVYSSKQALPRLLHWAQCISAHPHLYNPSVDEQKTYRYFRIILQSLKNLEIPSIRRKTFIQFSCVLYDLPTSSYIGHTYFTEMFQIQSRPTQKAVLNSLKSIYLYTQLENAVIKVDVWALQADKNKNNFEVMVKRAFLGSFTIDITHSNDSGRISKELSRREEDRFFENIQFDQKWQQPQSRQSNHISIDYQVLNTHSLTYLHLFVPPNLICDENDRIIGLKHGHISADGQITSDQRSKLRFELKEIVIPRSIVKALAESVEQQIMLSNEIIGRPMNTLKEMIFRIQFHNGWKSVSQQAIVLKDNLEPSMMLSKQAIQASTTNLKRKSKMMESTPKSYVYGVEKMRELNAVYLCEGGAFLMWIQAKMEFKFDIKINDQKKTKSEIIHLPVGFTVRSLDDRQEQTQEDIQLIPGNPYNLDHLLQLLTALKEQKQTNLPKKNKMTCKLMFYLIKSKGGLQSIEKNTLEKDAQEIQSLKAEKERLVRMRRKIKEEKRKKLIEINQEIPFLDPTKLKEELYLEKIEKIRSEKQEKEDILFYLKAKVNQLQRQALSFNYNRGIQNQQSFQSSTKLAQKLPEYFIDYKPDETPVDLTEGVSIDIFSASYCRKAQKVLSKVEKALVAQFMDDKTYLSLKIVNFQSLREEVQQFTIFLYDFSGRSCKLGPMTFHQMHHQSINILITQQSSEFTNLVLTSLMNSFLPLYILCGSFKKLIGVTFIDAEKLLQEIQTSSICLPFTRQLVTFKQKQTELAQLELILSFTQSVRQDKLSDLQQNVSLQMSGLIRGREYSLISRINRYKQQTTVHNSAKAQLIHKVVSSVKVEKIKINYNHGISQIIKLKVPNQSNFAKTLNLKLFDQDQQYLRQQQAKVIYKSTDPRVADTLQMVSFKSSSTIEIKPNCTQLLVLEYFSARKAFNPASPFFNLGKNCNLQMGTYNHNHKITVTLTQCEHNLVYQIYEIEVVPIIQPNTLYIQTFISEKNKIVLPIPCKSLEVEQPSPLYTLTPTRAIITAQMPAPSQSSLLQLHLLKHNPLNNQRESFQNIELYIHSCAHHALECRLWQQQDVMLKVPLQAILKKEIELNYPVQSLKVESKHIDFKLRAKDECSYSIQMGFSRKYNEVFIRGKVESNTIGKQIYPVEISDQLGTVIHRVCITNEVEFPTLTPDKIINIKLPKQNLGQEEQFSYKSLSEKGEIYFTKSLKPQLMQIKERSFEMKSGQTVELTLQFNWRAIEQYLQDQQRDECQLLIGVVGTYIIDYYLLRCRA